MPTISQSPSAWVQGVVASCIFIEEPQSQENQAVAPHSNGTALNSQGIVALEILRFGVYHVPALHEMMAVSAFPYQRD